MDPARLEILVVDNGSTDETSALLRDWAAVDPSRRRVATEPRAGISRARNLGAELARGEILLFLDDDAVAAETWASAHLARYEDPRVGAVGGVIALAWPDGRPSWLGPDLEPWFSGIDLGPEPFELTPPLHPFGSNMSLRRETLLEAGGFATELGRRGRSLVSCEEFELAIRLTRRGVGIVWEPGAVVSHRIKAERLRRRWILRRGWAQGRSIARLDRRVGSGSNNAAAASWSEARTAAATLPALTKTLRPGRASTRLNELAMTSWHLAAAVEHVWLALGRGPREPAPSTAAARSETTA